MDFSKIPFNSALDRFGHLLPIGTFIRLQTVVPNSQKVSLVKRRFSWIVVESSSPAYLSMLFTDANSETKYTVHYDSPEAVLNDGPVECHTLALQRAEGVPVEAVTCKHMLSLSLATPAVLPFMACGANEVFFLDEEIDGSQISITLKDVLSHFGPNVEYLTVPLLSADEVVDFPPPTNNGFRLLHFEIRFSSINQFEEWMEINAHKLILSRFCRTADIFCRNHFLDVDDKEEWNKFARICSTSPVAKTSEPTYAKECMCLRLHFSNTSLNFLL